MFNARNKKWYRYIISIEASGHSTDPNKSLETNKILGIVQIYGCGSKIVKALWNPFASVLGGLPSISFFPLKAMIFLYSRYWRHFSVRSQTKSALSLVYTLSEFVRAPFITPKVAADGMFDGYDSCYANSLM